MKTRRLGALLILAAIGFWTFWPVLSLGFTDVDTLPLILTSRVQSWSDFWEILSQPYLSGRQLTAHFFRPALSLSVAWDEFVWGLNPFGYHLTNLALHAANGVWLFFLVGQVQRLVGSAKAGNAIQEIFPVLAAALFIIHPLQLEVVPSLARRGDLLATFFILSSLTALFHYVETKKNASLAFALATCFFAMGAKELALLTPALTILLLATFRDRLDRATLWRTLLLFAVAGAIHLAWRVAVLGGIGGYFFGRVPFWASFKSGLNALGMTLVAPFSDFRPRAASTTFPWGALTVLGLTTLWSFHVLKKATQDWPRALVLALLIPVSSLGVFSLSGRLTIARYLYLDLVAFAPAIVAIFLFSWQRLTSFSRVRAAGVASVAAGLVSAIWLGSLVATSPRIGPILGLTNGLDIWRQSSGLLKTALSTSDKDFQALANGTRIFVINAPYCVAEGCSKPHAPILLEHTVQAWLDLYYPEKRFTAVGVNYLKIKSLDEFKTTVAFHLEKKSIELELQAAGDTQWPWEPEYLENHRHDGALHDDFYKVVQTSGSNRLIQFTDRLLQGPSAFLVFRLLTDKRDRPLFVSDLYPFE